MSAAHRSRVALVGRQAYAPSYMRPSQPTVIGMPLSVYGDTEGDQKSGGGSEVAAAIIGAVPDVLSQVIPLFGRGRRNQQDAYMQAMFQQQMLAAQQQQQTSAQPNYMPYYVLGGVAVLGLAGLVGLFLYKRSS